MMAADTPTSRQDPPDPAILPDREERENGLTGSNSLILATLTLTGLIFLTDALTPQRLVVSILLDVPIALSALSLKRSVTTLMVFLGILSNIVAGIINAHQEGSTDSIAIANRFFSAISLVLVGYLSIRIQDGAIRTGRSLANTRRFLRAQKMQKILGKIDSDTDPDDLLREILDTVRDLFRAKGVLIARSRQGRWCAPVLLDPETAWFWEEGSDLPGGITLHEGRHLSGPIRQMSLAPVLDRNNASEGYYGQIPLAAGDPGEEEPAVLHLFILEPHEEETPAIFAEALPMLEGMIHRSESLHRLKTRNEQLLRSNNLLRDLVYGFSHDIRTPLVANALNMNLALEDAWGPVPEPLKPILLQARLSQESLLSLANSLILLSRYELNEIPEEQESIPLDDLIREILRELDPLLGTKRLQTEIRLSGVVIRGDRQAIKRLLTNIIDNAIKWSPEGGTIRLFLDSRNGRATVSVHDEGPGVPDHVKPFLFKRFGGMHPGGGFGLGVYLADQIARRHGGTIRLVPSDTGARFDITLEQEKENS